ncbi:hypothetical protein V1227_18860 [Lentzea sp. DG1S-22]|uniref:hypothetical protein n=1 Tax=Lentzea sp. DG1S-22 TaxID=3108822 RepID=UPI002E7970A9|nr:hypothetical protein [Lentzea sp. DG1S-22]WVH84709.1 hypothetical protein V1227_18860 [Lentzea sp. DG1S-22]
MPAITTQLAAALDRFGDAWADGMLASSVSESLACSELDALANVLFLMGYEEQAVTWLVEHGESSSEEEEDNHFEWTREDAEQELRDRTAA